ncbi:Spy/CpxP family protein refolding chaperone [Desulfovibrio inopinatus]|uniref:Spy/CpxP family protein refolding chaperone n=1 Tax=Desulfovibrio inopinatus TaxID=102109 RepID=UPI0003FFB2F8|nr:Spy/CpxP family protein refolding chaperone [Desulfovibrio inopinatus]
MTKKLTTLVLTGLLILSSVSLAFARPGGPGGPGGEAGIVRMIMRLDLTTEQKQSVASILKAQRETGEAKIVAFRDAMKALHDTSTTDTFNEEAVRKAYTNVSKTGEELAIMRARVYAEVMSVLTPQQRETLSKERKEMAEKGKYRIKKHMSLLDEWIDKYTSQQ